MKTLLKLFFISVIFGVAIYSYLDSDTPLSALENAEALGQQRIEIRGGTGTLLCDGRYVNSRVTVR